MAEVATLARPYANAVFDLARSLDRMAELLEGLVAIDRVVKARAYLEGDGDTS